MPAVTTSPSFYTVRVSGDKGTPPENLFGDIRPYGWKREAAEALARDWNSERCWGPRGNLSPAEVGMTYYIDKMSAEETVLFLAERSLCFGETMTVEYSPDVEDALHAEAVGTRLRDGFTEYWGEGAGGRYWRVAMRDMPRV